MPNLDNPEYHRSKAIWEMVHSQVWVDHLKPLLEERQLRNRTHAASTLDAMIDNNRRLAAIEESAAFVRQIEDIARKYQAHPIV